MQTFANSNFQHCQPVQPLAAHELVTDAALRVVAHGEPDWQRGTMSTEMQAYLCMILPDICGELLAHRAKERANSILPFPVPRNHGEEIENMRARHAGRHPATNIGE